MPKSRASRNWVPVIPPLAAILAEYRQLTGGDGRMFPFSLGHIALVPLRRAMREAGVACSGFHAARRGLASNLFELGCDDLTVSRVLRHQGVQVTRQHYIKLRDSRVDSAMQKLSDRWDGNGTDAAREVQQVLSTLEAPSGIEPE